METLQSIYSLPLRTVKECIDHLGWTCEDDGDGGWKNIACPCGGDLEFTGYVGTDHVECLNCHKTMQDGLGFVQNGAVTMALITTDDFSLDEEQRHWLAILSGENEFA